MESYDLFDVTKEIVLKPLQTYAYNEIRNAMRTTKRLVFQAGCGFGKTILAAKIATKARENGKRVVFITDRIILANQSSDVFKEYGINHGVIQAQNERFNIDEPVQICNIQTIKRRGCPPADIIIIDECHCLSEAHKKIMQENKDAYILGLSATPYAKGMGKYFDTHIEPVPVRQLIENKYLVDFDIYGPSVADLTKLKVRAGEFTEESVAETFDKFDIIGDVVKVWKKLADGRKTIIFGANIAHIKHLVDSFMKSGVSACQINAYQNETERKGALDEFVNGPTTVLCSVEAAQKGFDCPQAEVCVLAVATKSMIKFTQTCGRVLRTFPGKERAMIIDCGGNTERLGFFDSFEFLGLDDGKEKNKSKAQPPKEKLPKACPSCDFLKPVGMRKCPACGFTPELKKDVEATEGDLEKLKRKARKEYTIAEKQQWLAQLNQYAAGHGYKFGWAIHKYVDKFGCRPDSRMDWYAREPCTAEVEKFIIHCIIKWENSNKNRYRRK